MAKQLLIITLAILLFSCKTDSSKITERVNWERLTITAENRVKIIVKNYDDSSTVIVYHKGSIFRPVKKVTIDTIKVWFTKSERDSLALLSQSLIAEPAKTTNFCTEFVGMLKLDIESNRTVRTVNYESVCDWTKLSKETTNLHAILKRKLKKVYLGDNGQ
jgi:hypothetical protein